LRKGKNEMEKLDGKSDDTQDQASHIAAHSNTLFYRLFTDTALFYSGDVVKIGSLIVREQSESG